jgi:hypothetical protein
MLTIYIGTGLFRGVITGVSMSEVRKIQQTPTGTFFVVYP